MQDLSHQQKVDKRLRSTDEAENWVPLLATISPSLRSMEASTLEFGFP